MPPDCSNRSLLTVLFRWGLASLLWAAPVFSQNEVLEALVEESRIAIEAQDWERALEINTRAADEFGRTEPLKTIGPQFGAIYYQKGLSEMKLGKWAEAAKSFEICYRDFPNGPMSVNGNIYQKLALLKWGEAAMGAGDWEMAASRFQKFIEERDRTRDRFPQGPFHIHLSICLYRLGKISEGNEHLEIAVQNLRNFPTPAAGMMRGVQALVAAAIHKGNEQVLLDFIEKNRGELMLEPHLMSQHTPVMMTLAGDALGAGMSRAAMALYSLVPSTDVAIDDTRARLNAMAGASTLNDGSEIESRQRLESHLATLEAERRDKNSPEMIKLAAVAFIHESKGNLNGAYAAYQQLELYFPHAEKREDHLFNLVRLSARIHATADIRSHGIRFLQAFPKSGFASEVRRLVLESMANDGDSSAFLEVAVPMVEAMSQGTEEHDHGLYSLGISYHQWGRFEESAEVLKRHMSLYPMSCRAISAAFYQASSMARLQRWEEAAKSLDEFLATYPDPSGNEFLAEAIYERAACHFALGENDLSLEKLSPLGEVPNIKLQVRVALMKGHVLWAMNRLEEATGSYQIALKSADGAGDRAGIEEALVSCILVRKAREGKPAEEVIPLADRYWKDFAKGSTYQRDVAVAQMRAFQLAGRGDEAMARLRDMIWESVGRATLREVEEMIRCYTHAYVERHRAEELESHYADLLKITQENPSVRALLRMEVIDAFEKVARESRDEMQVREAVAKIKVIYQEIRNEFPLKNLSNPALLRLADHLRLATSTPREALTYYDELIGRSDPADRFHALLGRGDLRARESAPEVISKALDDFTQVYHESPNAEDRDYALFRMIELQVAKGDFAKAAAQAGDYLAGEIKFHTFVPQVKLLLAKCYVETKLNDEAISIYETLWTGHADQMEISGPAMIHWMRLVWARDRPGDRQRVVASAADFLESKERLGKEDSTHRPEIEGLIGEYRAQLALQPGAPEKQ